MDSYFYFFQIFEYFVPLLMALEKKQLLKYSDYISLNERFPNWEARLPREVRTIIKGAAKISHSEQFSKLLLKFFM